MAEMRDRTAVDLAQWWDKAYPNASGLSADHALRWVAVPVPVLARLVACARALRDVASGEYHDGGHDKSSCRACLIERALVGIVDSAQEPPHD